MMISNLFLIILELFFDAKQLYSTGWWGGLSGELYGEKRIAAPPLQARQFITILDQFTLPMIKSCLDLAYCIVTSVARCNPEVAGSNPEAVTKKTLTDNVEGFLILKSYCDPN